MTVEQFVERIREDTGGRHVLAPGLTDAQLASWKASNPSLQLPADFVAVLRGANGVRLRVTADTSRGAFALHPLERVQFAPHVMFRGDRSFDGDFPRTWLALAEDADASLYLVLDVASGRYLAVDPIDTESPDVVATDAQGMLDWLTQFLAD